MTMISMSVKSENESRRLLVSDDFQKVGEDGVFDEKKIDRSISVLMKSKRCAESETDQESGGSSEEMDSPRSVERWRRKKAYVHSQILRIREEDSHLGEDISERLDAKENRVASSLDVFLFSRPILPCSPLSGKTAVKAMH
ncbi:hypothetical protein UlMin_014762 [Ulmus minor]